MSSHCLMLVKEKSKMTKHSAFGNALFVNCHSPYFMHSKSGCLLRKLSRQALFMTSQQILI